MAARVVPDGANATYGYHPNIQTVHPANIQVIYKAEYEHYTCGWCRGNPDGYCMDRSRRYLYVLENAYERTFPTGCSGNFCCPGGDGITKLYFDRGIYDQQSFEWRSGYVRGAPSTVPNNVKYVCCCMDCIDCCNGCCDGCYYPSLCGDRVRVLPYETYCCCLPARSCWFFNCCSLCGPKDGEPLPQLLVGFEMGLKLGTAPLLAQSMESARASWKARTGAY